MKDGTAAKILFCQELKDIIGDVHQTFSHFFNLKWTALADRIAWS